MFEKHKECSTTNIFLQALFYIPKIEIDKKLKKCIVILSRKREIRLSKNQVFPEMAPIVGAKLSKKEYMGIKGVNFD